MQREASEDFSIKILTLAPGKYTFEWTVTAAFFEAYEHSLVSRGNLLVRVRLEKTETMLRTFFDIAGTIELESDRTLDLFNHPISISQQLMYKFGDKDEELSEELYQIAWETPVLDLKQPIYEFIMLSVPMRKLKPSEEEEPEGTVADTERRLVYKSETSPDEQPKQDPAWEALRKLFPK